MRKFSCPQKDTAVINGSFLRKYGYGAEDIFFSAEGMAAAAESMQQETNAGFCTLPFCHTTEAEGFGADIVITATVGARNGEYMADDFDELPPLPDWDLESGRFAVALEACRLLKARGKRVIFNITGPCGILNCMLPSVAIFMALRDDSEELQDFYAACSRNLLRWAAAAVEAGADCISYGDPIAAGDMLGPVYSKKLAQSFILGFLEALRQTVGDKASLTVCPKTGLLLQDVLTEEEMPLLYWRADKQLQMKASDGMYCCCAKSLLKAAVREGIQQE